MSRRGLITLIAVFVTTRVFTGYLADHPEHYGPAESKVTGDTVSYEYWAGQILVNHVNPYSEIGIEYPPGSLPFIVTPGIEKPLDDTYRTRFVLLMMGVDLAGFLVLLVLARRWGSVLGPWLWVAVVPLLGPISYNRLDLVPAVATILAVERFSARSWFGGGGWLGYGVVAKVYPALFLPVAFAAARRKQVVVGAAVVAFLFLVPHLGFLDDVYRNVVGYHTDRGIQIESLWGFVLLLASKFGHAIGINYSFGALHVGSELEPPLKAVAQVLSLGFVAAGVWLAHRWAREGRPASAPELAGIMFMTMAGTMAVGSVFSPQFMLWLGALAAAALCDRSTWLRVPALAVLPAALMTQFVYPFFYGRLVAVEIPALVLLASRNFLVLFIAVEAFLALRARTGAAESEQEATPALAGEAVS
ncbi:MAG TPA: glycosyltransferase 87 family protein [Actinomycetota bacterium]|nr:glycosyltransferase 87 family protein [Actinomycetota bacterium]